MKVLNAEEFLEMPSGTVFAFGPAFAFSSLMIKDESIIKDTYWGFWACNPCWIEAEDGDDFKQLQGMKDNGVSCPMCESYSKYMSYDGDDFECFLVFELDDLKKLQHMIGLG